MLVVDAGAEHLIELRQLIYAQTEPSAPPPPSVAMARSWRLVATQAINYTVELHSAAQIHALLTMTPHAHRIAPERRIALAQVNGLAVTINVVCRVLKSPASP